MKQNNRDLLRYSILLILFGIGLWQIHSGNINFGSGLLGGAIFAFIASTIKQSKIRKVQEQGMNPYDERNWSIAGKAAHAAYQTFALGAACIVLFGSIWGPQTLVNPYNLLGLCLGALVLLYVCFFYYYSRIL